MLNMIPSETDAAWAAGFIEADGSFSIILPRERGVRPVIQVTQKVRSPLDRLQKILGHGHWHQDKKGFWKFQIIGKNRIKHAGLLLLPYLQTKYEQCELMIECAHRQGSRGITGYTEEQWAWFRGARERMKALNSGD